MPHFASLIPPSKSPIQPPTSPFSSSLNQKAYIGGMQSLLPAMQMRIPLIVDILSLRVGNERVFFRICEDCRTRKDYEIWQCLDCEER